MTNILVDTIKLLAATNFLVGFNHGVVEPKADLLKTYPIGDPIVLFVRNHKPAFDSGKTNSVVIYQGTNRIVLQRTNGTVEVSFE